ncbi:ketohydroxyglutarate aldolase [Faecalibaculum rodentium]|jgi:2-dehydro-3-deoxyphosphogluconate aldolase/(4S)-4-hydroxy-2-oxoglutarate aldolase|uniref:ketohydroxyglutarate aldolase n=1 Tax=Faecalibaculum rodentium TaxID=1702221 RepID=UPI0033068EAC
MRPFLKKADITCRIADCGAMAIVRTTSCRRAEEIARGCLAGGIYVMEISCTNNNAPELIAHLRKKFPGELLVGAGTVLDGETAREVILHDAQFVIAPNLSKSCARVCSRYQVPYMPGCTSVTEAVKALELGAAFVKAFPISDFYGPKLVSVFKTPIPDLPVLASGGITLDNLADYIRRNCDVCGFGGLLTKGTEEEIARNARKIRRIIDQSRTL